MERDTVIILGIPIDNLSLPEAAERIFEMISEYRQDGIPRQVATVNVDFIVNTLSWEQEEIRHPELLDILRRADLVTADGMPVVWMSRLLGCPLKERVTGADMVPYLATEAAKRGASLYFLGGRGDVGQRAADLLLSRNPGLKIAGVSSPFVHTEGERLADFEVEDEAIVNEINAASPDILLIAFGNPKQELWFARNAPRLKVPVSIGIGGTFEFIVGTVSRAPVWVQRAGLEWIYRLLMEPRRLWKRYAVGLLKFSLHAWPAIRNYRTSRKRLSEQPPREDSVHQVDEDVCVIALPTRFNAMAARDLGRTLDEAPRCNGYLVFDLAQVEMIDSSGLGFLVRMWRQEMKGGGKLILISLNERILKMLRLNRIADIFKDHTFSDRQQALEYIRMNRLSDKAPYRISMLRNGAVVVTLRGRLDAFAMRSISFDDLLSRLDDRQCILDLASLEFADSSGLVAFIRVQRHVTKFGKSCILYAPNASVRQLLRLTRFDRLFTTTDDRSILHDA